MQYYTGIEETSFANVIVNLNLTQNYDFKGLYTRSVLAIVAENLPQDGFEKWKNLLKEKDINMVHIDIKTTYDYIVELRNVQLGIFNIQDKYSIYKRDTQLFQRYFPCVERLPLSLTTIGMGFEVERKLKEIEKISNTGDAMRVIENFLNPRNLETSILAWKENLGLGKDWPKNKTWSGNIICALAEYHTVLIDAENRSIGDKEALTYAENERTKAAMELREKKASTHQ